MRPSSWLLALVLAAGFLAAGPRPAAACSCSSIPTPCQAFASSPIVFVGDVLSSRRPTAISTCGCGLSEP
jgi:hypothetical protein